MYLRIDQDLCAECEACIPYCPMGAIISGPDGVTVDEGECVECNICRHADVCPTDALVMPELDWPRSLRHAFSDPLTPHEGTNVPGRGTEEMKTNDVTGRIKPGWVGMAAEVGRPGVGTRFSDVEKVSMAVAQCDITFEPQNPVYFLLADERTGKLRDDVLSEKVLSAIVEFIAPISEVPEILRRLREAAARIDTVFSIDISCRTAPDGSVPTVDLIKAAGLEPSLNGKVNVGLGRPLAEEGAR